MTFLLKLNLKHGPGKIIFYFIFAKNSTKTRPVFYYFYSLFYLFFMNIIITHTRNKKNFSFDFEICNEKILTRAGF